MPQRIVVVESRGGNHAELFNGRVQIAFFLIGGTQVETYLLRFRFLLKYLRKLADGIVVAVQFQVDESHLPAGFHPTLPFVGQHLQQ